MAVVRLAGCVILDSCGRPLLLHRHTPAYIHWELPGGKVESGETPARAASREVYEELGILVGIERFLIVIEFVDRGTPFRYHYYLARTVSGRPGLRERNKFDGIGYHDLVGFHHTRTSMGVKCLRLAIFERRVVF